MNKSNSLSSVNQIINYLKNREIAHLYTEDLAYRGNEILINGEYKTNFGSCSYLGLEFDQRLIATAKDAIESYGTQFSASRAYVSATPYRELEGNLEKLFGNPIVVTPTTTLGHMAAIPVLVDNSDLIVLDHQVHNSVQMAAKLKKAEGAEIKMLRHNRMDLLEDLIKSAAAQNRKIWYFADGIYSMFGDFCPIKELESLLNKYGNFNLYVDDAHGMSCYGKHGRGYVLSQIEQHERMVVATSFAKAFASGGGVIIFPNQRLADAVRNCGGPMITSGPMQPGALGAAIASSYVHLSDEIYVLQEELFQKVQYANQLLKEYRLPNISEPNSPIFFVGVGTPKVGYNLVSRMVRSGHLVNIGIFPAVSMKNTGLRFTITRMHSFEQIEHLVQDLAHHFKHALSEENVSIEEICKAFALDPEEYAEDVSLQETTNSSLILEWHDSILDVSKNEWDENLGGRGMFDWNGMAVMEHALSNVDDELIRTKFIYCTIRDLNQDVVIQTIITSGWTKDDMLESFETSKALEDKRSTDPFLACSKYVCVGTPITEGEHLYINDTHSQVGEALKLLFDRIDCYASEIGATTKLIRDFSEGDNKIDDVMIDNGYFKFSMPSNYILDVSEWNVNEPFHNILRSRNKRRFRKNIEENQDKFEVKVNQKVSKSKLKKYYHLYKNVHSKCLELNTFELPFELFNAINNNKQWEFIEITLKEDGCNTLAAVVLAYKGLNSYTPAMIGRDYAISPEYNVYRQSLYQSIKAGKLSGYDQIRLGYTAGIEKKNLGASEHQIYAYMQVKDNFKMESLSTDSKRSLVAVETK